MVLVPVCRAPTAPCRQRRRRVWIMMGAPSRYSLSKSLVAVLPSCGQGNAVHTRCKALNFIETENELRPTRSSRKASEYGKTATRSKLHFNRQRAHASKASTQSPCRHCLEDRQELLPNRSNRPVLVLQLQVGNVLLQPLPAKRPVSQGELSKTASPRESRR